MHETFSYEAETSIATGDGRESRVAPHALVRGSVAPVSGHAVVCARAAPAFKRRWAARAQPATPRAALRPYCLRKFTRKSQLSF
ncbi:unnamed protein product [Leptosia nina]|uniref:Uncharacterized protein n=1 Tax=Leptosia nina TaxID=320188 RepID=A0AAV1JR59_9NEOP